MQGDMGPMHPDYGITSFDLAPVDVQELEEGNPLKKVRFQFRHQDEYILERIQAQADEQFAELFTEAITEMNRLYDSVRVPRYHGVSPITDSKGSQLWELGEDGKPIEDWDRLTGQDVEGVYLNLLRIKVFLAPTINKLKLDAMWAKIAAGDAKDDARVAIAQGLEADKTARANRDSREDRYLEFFQYYLWSTADCFYSQIIDFLYKLRDVRTWRIQSQG